MQRRTFLRTTAGAALAASPSRAEDLSALSPEHAAAAQTFMDFTARLDADFKARAAQLNGTPAMETRKLRTESANYTIDVVRGPVIEKGGTMMVEVFGDLPPRVKNPIFNRFYSIDIHPKTPWVGMAHLAITLGVDKQGKNSVYGWADFLPTIRVEEDIAAVRAEVDKYFASVGRDPKPHHDLICAGDPSETVEKWRRKPSCAGVSLYPPPTREATKANTAFVAGAVETFYRAFMALVERRANAPFGEKELAAQAAMRKNWLEDQLFSDPFSSRLVPYEAWSFASGPPDVHY